MITRPLCNHGHIPVGTGVSVSQSGDEAGVCLPLSAVTKRDRGLALCKEGMNTIAWADQGLVLDMTDYIASSPYAADYNNSYFAPFTTPDGKIYALPALTGGRR